MCQGVSAERFYLLLYLLSFRAVSLYDIEIHHEYVLLVIDRKG